MNKSCLFITPAVFTLRVEVMERESNMGANSVTRDDSVEGADAEAVPERAPLNKSASAYNSATLPPAVETPTDIHHSNDKGNPVQDHPPRQIICQGERKDRAITSSRQFEMDEDVASMDFSAIRKLRRSAHRSDLCGEGSVATNTAATAASTTTASSDRDHHPSLPQHEQIQPEEPVQIKYGATLTSTRLKEVLVSRLEIAARTGRIQQVRHCARRRRYTMLLKYYCI